MEIKHCYYCGLELKKGKKSKKTIDHKIPKIRGGQSSNENEIECCSECNCKKDSMTEDEFKLYLKYENKIDKKKIKKFRKLVITLLNDKINEIKHNKTKIKLISINDIQQPINDVNPDTLYKFNKLFLETQLNPIIINNNKIVYGLAEYFTFKFNKIKVIPVIEQNELLNLLTESDFEILYNKL